MTTARQPPLLDLLDALRDEGYPIGVDDHLRVARVIATDSDWTRDKLHHALRSILSTDVHSRARFDQVFERVFTRPGGRWQGGAIEVSGAMASDPDADPGNGEQPGEEPALDESADGPSRGRSPGDRRVALVWSGIAALCVAVAAIAWLQLSKQRAERADERAREAQRRAAVTAGLDATPDPADGAEGVVPQTDIGPSQSPLDKRPSDGTSGQNAATPTGSLGKPSSVTDGEWGPSGRLERPVERVRGGNAANGDRPRPSKRGPQSQLERVAPAPPASQPPPSEDPRPGWVLTARAPMPTVDTSRRDLGIVVAWSLLAGGLAALLAGLFFRTRVRRRRRTFVGGPWRYRRQLPREQLPPVFSEHDIEDGAAALTWQPLAEGGQALDVARTVARTVEAGGFPTPAYRPPPPAPEYAVLIDAGPASKAWRDIYDELFTGLARTGVRVRRFRFFGVPDVVTAEDSGREVSLGELAEEMDAVIAVGDGDLARDPFSRQSAPWVAALEHFPHRLWLNPLPVSRWSDSAHLIARTTTMVHGASAVLGALQPGATLGPSEREAGPYPAVIETAPASALAHRALSGYLGAAAMRALSVTAVAGAPEPGVARWLIARLGIELTESERLRLMSLPWWQRSRWPAGLRERLLTDLHAREPEVETRVQALLVELLQASEPAVDSMAHLQWELDRAVVLSQLGEPRERELHELSLSPLHAEAARERIKLGLADRVARGLWAFALVGAAAMLVGAVFGYRLIGAEPPDRPMAQKQRALSDWQQVWGEVKTCFQGTEKPLPDLVEALAFRLATTADPRGAWSVCDHGVGVLAEFALNGADDGHGDGARWMQLAQELARTREAARADDPETSYRQLAQSIASVDTLSASLHRRLDMATPMPTPAQLADGDVHTLLLLGDALTDTQGTPVSPMSVERQGATLVIRGQSPAGDPLLVAYGRGTRPEDRDVYSQARNTVRAMAGADWGLKPGGYGEIGAGQLDEQGEVQNPAFVFGGTPAIPAKGTAKKKRIVRSSRARLLPRYALGRGRERLAVAENVDFGGFSVAKSSDGGRSWQSTGEVIADAWREDWAGGRLLGLFVDARGRNQWALYTEGSMAEDTHTGTLGGGEVGEVRTGCVGCNWFYSIHEQGAYRFDLAGFGDAQLMPLPASEEALAACSDDVLLTLLATGERTAELYECGDSGCERLATMPRRSRDQVAIGRYQVVGPLVAYIDRGFLVVWRRWPGDERISPRPVRRAAPGLAGLQVAAVQVWRGQVTVALRDESNVWLVAIDEASAPLQQPPEKLPEPQANLDYQVFPGAGNAEEEASEAGVPYDGTAVYAAIAAAADADDIDALSTAYRSLRRSDPLSCQAQTLYERGRQQWLQQGLARLQPVDGKQQSCLLKAGLMKDVRTRFPSALDVVAAVPCECPDAETCANGRLSIELACCQQYQSSKISIPIEFSNDDDGRTDKRQSQKRQSQKRQSQKRQSQKRQQKKKRSPEEVQDGPSPLFDAEQVSPKRSNKRAPEPPQVTPEPPSKVQAPAEPVNPPPPPAEVPAKQVPKKGKDSKNSKKSKKSKKSRKGSGGLIDL